ncbi:MAG TPA: hypothetical protein PKM25_08360, partial [Candidatus Ozemobacteraceae bacterium]|nr:hypothetical protein [Candidatus Ozemobacteraceae bacterium]
MLHKHPLHPILSLFIALLIGSSTMWACNSFSHQWSLTGLEEETDRLPRLAMGELFRRLPQHLASASVAIPWLQTASSVLLLEVDAATYSWVFQNAPQQGASKSCGILAQTSEMPR